MHTSRVFFGVWSGAAIILCRWGRWGRWGGMDGARCQSRPSPERKLLAPPAPIQS